MAQLALREDNSSIIFRFEVSPGRLGMRCLMRLSSDLFDDYVSCAIICLRTTQSLRYSSILQQKSFSKALRLWLLCSNYSKRVNAFCVEISINSV